MKIKTIQLQGYGLFSSVKFEFSTEELNLIFGNNETGKSTLCSAIPAIVYGFSDKAEAKRRQSWNVSSEFKGRIELEIKGESYIIERNFKTDNVVVQRIGDGTITSLFDGDGNPKGRTEIARGYRKLLYEDIGFPPATIFFNSIYIEQLNLQLELSDELRRQISGAGNSDYLKALEELKVQYYALTRRGLPDEMNKKNERRYEEVVRRIEELKAELASSGSN